MKKYTTPNEKLLRKPAWWDEPPMVYNNPHYRCPEQQNTAGYRGEILTTIKNQAICGTIESSNPENDRSITDEQAVRSFCNLQPETRITLSHRVFTALFSGDLSIQVGQTTYHRKTFEQGVRAFDIKDYRYVEQNPRSTSQWAKNARLGCRILWVIRRSDDKWLGRVVEGVLVTF